MAGNFAWGVGLEVYSLLLVVGVEWRETKVATCAGKLLRSFFLHKKNDKEEELLAIFPTSTKDVVLNLLPKACAVVSCVAGMLSLLVPVAALGKYPLCATASLSVLVAIGTALGVALVMPLLLFLLACVSCLLLHFFRAQLFLTLPVGTRLWAVLCVSSIYSALVLFAATSLPVVSWYILPLAFTGLCIVGVLLCFGIVLLLADKERRAKTVLFPVAVLVIATCLCGAGLCALGYILWGTAGTTNITGTAHYGLPPPEGVPSPASDGPYAVKCWTYGPASHPPHRPSGSQFIPADNTVNFSPLLSFSSYRENYWGFDSAKSPLRGLLWTPDAPPPGLGWPILLISPGNHQMTDDSELGYEYLCQHLATHGVACASFDVDFLNSVLVGAVRVDDTEDCSPSDDMLARSLLYLEHTHMLAQWARNASHPLRGVIDSTRAIFSGHSRSGEAAAVAAWALTELSPGGGRFQEYPSYDIQAVAAVVHPVAVVAFAPTDSSYVPGDVQIQLKHSVDYLVIQGTSDLDQQNTFDGLRQYEGVQFSSLPGSTNVKMALYVYRANHGQWNTVWGDSDLGPATAWLLDRHFLLAKEDQQAIAKAAVWSLLNTTLSAPGSQPYLPVLRNWRLAENWLPTTNFKHQVTVSTERATLLVSFDNSEHADQVQHCGAGVRCAFPDTACARPLARDTGLFGAQRNRGIIARVARDEPPCTWTIAWDASVGATAGGSLVFDAGVPDVGCASVAPDTPDADPSVALFMSVTIEREVNGTNTTWTGSLISLDGGNRLAPTMPPNYARVGERWFATDDRVVMLDTQAVPVAELLHGAPDWARAADIAAINFQLCCEAEADCVLWLDNVGFVHA
eukprot:TRINITY_DN6385_c0_g1_i1.p1 TRINITY_DN6385_c0_g1~~TRINITY_DN6385_c0_g1_i1.p1  ORF type:complete len:853 (+),score=141.15 TRINITY_DN6385_c0_g1_i1:1106-3664(+)